MPKTTVKVPVAKTYNQTALKKELEFLDKLGGWAKWEGKPEGTGLSRLELLRRYRDSMHLRTVWGHIDPHEISEYVELAIRKEEAL